MKEGISCDEDVCKLNKVICGFERVLKDFGYKLDRGGVKENIYVLLYIYDVVIATGDINRMNNFKSYLKEK